MITLSQSQLPTPVGDLFLVEHAGTLCAMGFVDAREHAATLRASLLRRFPGAILEDAGGTSDIARRVAAYLAGDLAALDPVPVDLGGTPFQRRVWAALRRIPAGETRSYAELARAVGNPTAVRAVGAANAKNPVSLVVPCHRVIRSDGTLCGYAGGVARKRWLLAHEQTAGLRLQLS